MGPLGWIWRAEMPPAIVWSATWTVRIFGMTVHCTKKKKSWHELSSVACGVCSDVTILASRLSFSSCVTMLVEYAVAYPDRSLLYPLLISLKGRFHPLNQKSMSVSSLIFIGWDELARILLEWCFIKWDKYIRAPSVLHHYQMHLLWWQCWSL